MSPRFYLFGTLCQFGRDLICEPGDVIVSADRPPVVAGGNAIADFRASASLWTLGRPAIAAHPDVSELKNFGKPPCLLLIKGLGLP